MWEYIQGAGVPEEEFEDLKIQEIINGKNKNVVWNEFTTLLAMYRESAYPHSVKELEDMMKWYDSSITETTAKRTY